MTRPPPFKYAVVRAAPAEVAGTLQRLWDANLVVAGGAEQKYRWLYVDAPDQPDSVFLLEASAAGAEPRAVGTAGICVRRFSVGGRDASAALLADLAVDKEHRSLMPALSLVREVKAHALAHHDFAYGFPNKLAVGVFKRVGYRELGTITRYARVLRHAGYLGRVRDLDLSSVPRPVRSALERAVGMAAVAKLGGAALDAARLARGAPSALSAARAVRLDWLEAPDERFDALWEEARGDYQVVGRRSAAFLRWRFPAADGHKIAALRQRGGGQRLLAYAVVQRDGEVAHIRDLFGRMASLGSLLDLLVPALYRRGAASASIRYLGSPRVVALLTERGFEARQSDRTITVGRREPVPDGDEIGALVERAEAWHLLDADEDT
jgi:hypothetical protein